MGEIKMLQLFSRPLAAAVLLSTVACLDGFGQTKSSSNDEDWQTPFEIGVSGGGSFFRLRQHNDPTPNRLVNGGVFGVIATENLARYFGFEEQVNALSTANLRLELTPGTPINSIAFGSRLVQMGVGPIVYLAPPSYRVRPFVRAMLGLDWFHPTDIAKQQATSPYLAGINAARLTSKWEPAFLFGGGVKGDITRRVGVRIDALGSLQKNPHFGIPAVPLGPGSAAIPNGGTQIGFQAMAGVYLKLGKVAAAEPERHDFRVNVTQPSNYPQTIDSGCSAPGPQTLTVTASDTLERKGHKVKYEWMADGQPVGDNSPSYTYTPPATAGQHKVSVRVSDDVSASKMKDAARPFETVVLVVNIDAYQAPTISINAPSSVKFGEKTSYSVQTSGKCGGLISYTCVASEGSVSPSSNPTTFDSTGVNIDLNRVGTQNRPVTITCTPRDDKGSGSPASATINVTYTKDAPIQPRPVEPTEKPKAIRYEHDIVFPANNSRVNNCGKKVIDEIYDRMRNNPGYKLVLIGHTGKGEKAGSIDKERVLNTAALLTAGTDTCKNLEPSRITVDWVGGDQTSPEQPYFCGSSTTVQERKGQEVSADDANAGGRRVEIWFVPADASNPDALKSGKPAEEQLKAKTAAGKVRGCPK